MWTIDIDKLPEPGQAVVSGRAVFACLEEEGAGGLSVQGKGEVVAYLNVCTHMGCRLVRTAEPQCLTPQGDAASCSVLGPCPCHGSSFDLALAGLVVFGPATASLPRLDVRQDCEQLIATLCTPSDDPLQENWPS